MPAMSIVTPWAMKWLHNAVTHTQTDLHRHTLAHFDHLTLWICDNGQCGGGFWENLCFCVLLCEINISQCWMSSSHDDDSDSDWIVSEHHWHECVWVLYYYSHMRYFHFHVDYFNDFFFSFFSNLQKVTFSTSFDKAMLVCSLLLLSSLYVNNFLTTFMRLIKLNVLSQARPKFMACRAGPNTQQDKKWNDAQLKNLNWKWKVFIAEKIFILCVVCFHIFVWWENHENRYCDKVATLKQSA